MNPHRTAKANEAALRKVLTQRTLVALSKQNVAFVLEHQNDTWQELSQYLARCQATLGRAPARTEVLGGDFIELRFGSWGKALASIGVENGGRLPTPDIENTRLFRDEYDRQRTADKQAKLEKKKTNKEIARQEKSARKAAKQAAQIPKSPSEN